MSIQFEHRLKERLTLVADIDYKKFKKIRSFQHLDILFGFTRVHPDDRYEKKIGRELCLSRANLTKFFVTEEKRSLNDTLVCFRLQEMPDLCQNVIYILVDHNIKSARMMSLEKIDKAIKKSDDSSRNIFYKLLKIFK